MDELIAYYARRPEELVFIAAAFGFSLTMGVIWLRGGFRT